MAVGDLTKIKGGPAEWKASHIAHGVITSFAVVIWFPLGVFVLRLFKVRNTVRFHMLWQAIGLVMMVIGFGLGSWTSTLMGGLYDRAHVILGIMITLLFVFVMPIMGWLHHKYFVANGTMNWKRQTHVWLGRVLFVLGIVNGGTGLKLADNTKAGSIAYGVVAGIMVVVYVGIWFMYKHQAKSQAQSTGVPGESMEMKTSA